MGIQAKPNTLSSPSAPDPSFPAGLWALSVVLRTGRPVRKGPEVPQKMKNSSQGQLIPGQKNLRWSLNSEARMPHDSNR